MENILIVGKPNSGKSLLFNRLTGLSQKVANFPGVTVELKRGKFEHYEMIDFPGAYSLEPLTIDEKVSVDKIKEALSDGSKSVIVCNLDATRLERSLIFGLQIQHLAKKHGKPIVFALNMIDEVEKTGAKIDAGKLAEQIGSPVFSMSAHTTQGLDSFRRELLAVAAESGSFLPTKSVEDPKDAILRAKELGKKFAPASEVILKNQNFLDGFFLNHFLGGIVFLFIMAVLFQSIFTWASPLMDGVEELVGFLGGAATSVLSDGMFKDFVNDALFGGIGSFLVFVPQIAVLTFIIGLLEDSGYLARAALICHKPLSYFGLSGKSFIPYLSGHACAIPAIMAARTIESPKKRLITILTVPFMACSARLPVYALLVTALIPDKSFAGGLFSYKGLAFLALYMFGFVMALVVSAMLSKVKSDSDRFKDVPFLIELPPYRMPHWKPLFFRTINTCKQFVLKAGTMIFTVTLVIWVLGYFPNGGESLETSWLSYLGRLIDPIFAPLDLDWRYGVAILASFLAREVFVGTLGTLFGIEGADENIVGLATNIQASGLTLASGVALLVFYAIALQCVSTLAVIKKETDSSKAAWLVFAGYTVLAYVMALGTKLILA